EDLLRFGLEVLRFFHPLERPEQVHRRGAALRQHLVGLRGSFRKHNPKCGRATDRRCAAHHHVLDGLRDLLRGLAGDVLLLAGEKPLVQQLEALAGPADRLDFQTTRSLPPSTGTCAAVVLAKSAPHISAASSATSFDETSVLSRLRFLYCSTVRLYALARAARSSSVHRPVS